MEGRVYDIIYRLRKTHGLRIDIRSRTIYYTYACDADRKKMSLPAVRRLCDNFSFVRQAEIRTQTADLRNGIK